MAAGLLAGFVLQPAFGRDPYVAFYPVAPLCAWAMGPRPGLVATVLSAVVAFVCLGPGAGSLDVVGVAELAGFLAVSAAGVGLVSSLGPGAAPVRQPSASAAPPARRPKPVVAAPLPILEPATAVLAAEPERRRAIG